MSSVTRHIPSPRWRALEALLAGIVERWDIPPERIVGHADVAPRRKIDPGEKFDWRRLAMRGLAVWLDQDQASLPQPSKVSGAASTFGGAARRLGYLAPVQDQWTEEMLAVWDAFAMRFLPHIAKEEPNVNGVHHAEMLADRYPRQKSARWLVGSAIELMT